MGVESHAIFLKRRLTPGQLRAVADRRYDDAICLFDSRDNARLNGAMYIGGFVSSRDQTEVGGIEWVE
ncbi:MAG TPA: hypothetical protein VFC78_16760 [Tepidisphaeraceae bacterium]|nr:hypothetical protein [Tepidisphaeraceae bacterium]